MVRHLFAGGNTPNGFYSYFDNILPFSESRKLIYMKGGSGNGKSTFMKKVGSVFEKKKYDIEYFHCSNDANSLDAVCIPKIKAAIIDATAPHTQDPSLPVAVDEILNVAVCLNRDGLRPYAEELKAILSEKKGFIQMAYGYLNSAYSIYKNTSYIYEMSLDKTRLNKVIGDLQNEIFHENTISASIGKRRKLFASAITPTGFVDYTKSLIKYQNIYVLKGRDGCGIDFLLNRIQEEANSRGFDTEGYYSPLSPEKLEHLLIPKLECCITTSNKYHKNNKKKAVIIDLYELCNSQILKSNQDNIEYNSDLFDELAGKSMNFLNESCRIHNRVEEIYISNMDFKQLNIMYDNTLKELLKLEEE